MTFEVAGDLSEDALNVFIQVHTLTSCGSPAAFTALKSKHPLSCDSGALMGKDVQKQRGATHDRHPVKGTLENSMHPGVGSDQ